MNELFDGRFHTARFLKELHDDLAFGALGQIGRIYFWGNLQPEYVADYFLRNSFWYRNDYASR